MAAKEALEGAGRLRGKLKALPVEVEGAIKTEVLRSALNVQAGARTRVAVDRGRLRNSIGVVPKEKGLAADIGTPGGAVGRQGMAVEFGRRAGSKQPPLKEIEGWVRRKGLAKGAKRGTKRAMERQIAFLIARSIARKGIPARPFLHPAFEQERPRFQSRLRAAVGLAQKRIALGNIRAAGL